MPLFANTTDPLRQAYASPSHRLNLAISLLTSNFGPIVGTIARHLLFKGPTSFLELVENYARYNENEIGADGVTTTTQTNAPPPQEPANPPAFDNLTTFKELSGTTHQVASSSLYNTPLKRYTIGEIRVAMLLLVRHSLVQWVEQDTTPPAEASESSAKKERASNKSASSKKGKKGISTKDNAKKDGATELDDDDLPLRIYFLNVHRVFLLLLFAPRFVALCVDRWGSNEALHMCKQFLVNGKLTYFDLLDRVQELRNRGSDDDLTTNEFEWKDRVNKIFDEMITARLLKRSESVEDVTDRMHTEIREIHEREDLEEKELLSRKKGKKAKTIEQQLGIDEETATLGSKKGTKRKKRKGTAAETFDDVDLRSTVAALSKKRKRTTNASPDGGASSPQRKKRKNDTFDSGDHDELDNLMDDEALTTSDDVVSSILQGKHPKEHIRNVLWELNFDQFVRDLRKKRIVDFVSGKYDENAAVIVESILEMTLAYQRTKNDPQTKPVQFDLLAGHIQRNYSHRVTMSSRVLDKLLETLTRMSLVERVSSQDRGSFRVNMGHIISVIKEQHLESIIHKKLGSNATRIFRMLVAKKYMEQKFVADEAMVQASEARKQLYLLMQNGYVQMEEVPKGSDRTNPMRTIFLWHVDQEKVLEMTTEEMYCTIFNLMTRLATDQERLLDRVGIGKHNPGMLSTYVFSDDQNRMLMDLKKMEDLLEASIARLSNMLMLFENF